MEGPSSPAQELPVENRRGASVPPPGTILTAGLLIGLAIIELSFLLVRPERFSLDQTWTWLTFVLWVVHMFALVTLLGMLAAGFGMLLRPRRWTPLAIVAVLLHGLGLILGMTVFEVMLTGLLEATPTAATRIGIALNGAEFRNARITALQTLVLFVLLASLWWTLRRRGDRIVPGSTWRRLLMVGEGFVACLFVGAMTYMAATVPRSMAVLYEAEEPADAAGARRGVQIEGDIHVDILPDIDPALLRNHLEAVSGQRPAVWEEGHEATLVNFWASWCPPCIEELPQLQLLHEQLAGRDVRIVLINVDLDRKSAGRFLKAKGITLDSLLDTDAAMFRALALQALPSTFVLNAKGHPVRFFEGGLSIEELETALLRANVKGVRRTFQ